MTKEEARGYVGEMRRALDDAMRAVSVPDPDWAGYAISVGVVKVTASECQDSAIREAVWGHADE